MRIVKGRGTNGTSTIDGIGDGEGKKINTGSKGVVFLFLRSGSGPLVHPLLLWLCHGLIDYRVHHEGIQCAFYLFALCQIVNRSISQKLFPSFLNEWIIPYLNAGLCEWCSFFWTLWKMLLHFIIFLNSLHLQLDAFLLLRAFFWGQKLGILGIQSISIYIYKMWECMMSCHVAL